jgi:hypothetical protein
MADTTDLKSVARKGVWVRVPPSLFNLKNNNMSELINYKYITEQQARSDGFHILAGPFLEGEMTMAYKIMDEVKKNHRHAALVERIKGKGKKNLRKHYEVWQKSANTYSSKK